MAKLELSDVNKAKIQVMMNRYSTYKSFSSSVNHKQVLDLLIQGCNGFCPFTGVFYPERKFSIEHFHWRQADNKENDLNIDNLYPCCLDANVSTKQNKLTLDPKDVNYVDRLYFDPNDFKIKAKNLNDKEAEATIKQFSLDKSNQIQDFRLSMFVRKTILRENFGDKYSFSEYF